MESLFEYPKNEFIKTNAKFGFIVIKKEFKANLKQYNRDNNCEKILNDVGGFPKIKNYLAIKTNGTSDCGSFFSYALKYWECIDDMYLATWTISKNNIKRLKESIENGKLKKLTMVFSTTLKQTNPALYNFLVVALKKYENVNLKEIHSHAKVFSISNGENYITVTGSANWSQNPRIENFLILNDKELFDHHKNWMSEFINIK